MREQIARWLREYKLNEVEVDNPDEENGVVRWDKAEQATKNYWLQDVDELFTLISEEIEKVENPYAGLDEILAFGNCRKAILSLLKE